MALHFNCCPSELDSEQVLDYLHFCQHQHKTPSASFFKHTVYGLRAVYRLKGMNDKRIVLPSIERSKKLPVVLSQKEVWQIIDSISHVKQKAIIAGLYLHGLRRSEILNLYYHNIDRERRLLIIREGKGKKDRFAPLNTIWTDYLSKYAKQMNHKKGYDKPIFYPYSASSISNIIKQKASKLGIKKRVYPHLLRDCFATHLSQQSVGNKFIQEILGHSRVTTTQKYIHLAAEDISKIALKRIA